MGIILCKKIKKIEEELKKNDRKGEVCKIALKQLIIYENSESVFLNYLENFNDLIKKFGKNLR